MYYHAKLTYSGKEHCWYNYNKNNILDNLIIPFVNGQVVSITIKGIKSLLNMKNASTLNIFQTEEKLKKSDYNISLATLVASKEFEKYDCTEEIITEYKKDILFPVRSGLERKFSQEKNEVFVIMKFGSKELDSAYEGVIEPVIREFNLTPIRVDKLQNSGKITDQIIESISSSKYIIADLTGERPNTYYETGFAHALGKDIILSIKKSETIHFDLLGHRFIEWETEADLRRGLRERFSSLVQENK